MNASPFERSKIHVAVSSRASPILTISLFIFSLARAGPVISPGALRIQSDMSDLELPENCTMHLPNKEDLMNFEVSITPDDGFWCVLEEYRSTPVLFLYDMPIVNCRDCLFSRVCECSLLCSQRAGRTVHLCLCFPFPKTTPTSHRRFCAAPRYLNGPGGDSIVSLLSDATAVSEIHFRCSLPLTHRRRSYTTPISTSPETSA